MRTYYKGIAGFILFIVMATAVQAQHNVAMNNSGTKAVPSAILDLSNNTTLGLLLPNVSLASITDASTIPSAPDGLIVYNTNTSMPDGVGFYYWSATASQWNYLVNSGNLVAGVTSASMTVPSIFNITGSPITSSGTFAVTLANENANTVFAGPSTGSPAAPTFRALALADLPTGIPNSNLVNSSITVNNGANITITGGPTLSLGGSVTVNGAGGTVTSVGPAAAGNTNTGGSGLYFSSNPITTTGTIGLAASGVTAGTYGSATAIPTFTVNAEGQITSASTVATPGGSVTSVGPGTPGAQTGTSGLTFSPNPITGAGTISVATAGVTNAMLANNSVSVVPGNGLALTSGSNPVSLGGTIGIGISAPVSIANGGSGTITAPAQYGVIYAGSTTAYSSTAAGATGSVLTGNGASAPTFQSITGLLGNGYLLNQTTTQANTNFYVQSTAATSVGGVMEGAAGQTADLLDLESSTPTILAKVDASGDITSQGLTSTGLTAINTTGAGVTTIGTGGTGAVIIGNNTGVGIKTNTPNALFNVNGTMYFGQSSATTGATTGTLTFYNSTNTGSVSIQSGSLLAANNYTMTLPVAQGGANTSLIDNGSGTLTWANPAGLLTVNNGLTLTGSNVQLGGALVQNTTVAGSSNAMAFDLGTGSAAGTGTFSVTNGGTGTPYLYAASSANGASVGIGNSAPGANLLNISNSTASTGVGNGISMTAQTGASGSAGGAVIIAGGAGGANASGGAVTIVTGASAGTANGANVIIKPTPLVGSGTANGGVAINNTGAAPNAAALVDMATNTSGPAGGLLIPRLASAPAAVADGLMYYNTTTNCFMFYSVAIAAWQSMGCICSGAPAAPASVNGSPSACVSSSYLYSISPVANASSYQWTVPTGATITSGQGTATINVTMPSSTGTGTISVVAYNGCGASGTTSLTVTIGAAPTGTGTISGTFTCLTASTSQSYSISGVTGATYYLWTVPTGWSITSGQGNSSLTVTTGASGGTLTCTPYSIAGGCPGTAATASVSIGTTPSTPSAPTNFTCSGVNTLFATSNTVQYTTGAVAGATAYLWSSSNTNVLTVTASTATPTVTVTAVAAGSANLTVQASDVPCSLTSASSPAVAITVIPQVQTFTANTNAVVPCGATSAAIYLWGGGGGGGGAVGDPGDYTNGGGGGGGACVVAVNQNLSSVAGTTYTLTVGAAGTAGPSTGTGNGGPGGVTTFSITATDTWTASGGSGGSGNTTGEAIADGGAGGTTGSGPGYTVFAGGGGSAGDYATEDGGCGGGGAGSTGAGGGTSPTTITCTVYAGGTGVAPGGPGGAGAETTNCGTAYGANGSPGTAPGGGGSGCINYISTTLTGGAGAIGKATIVW